MQWPPGPSTKRLCGYAGFALALATHFLVAYAVHRLLGPDDWPIDVLIIVFEVSRHIPEYIL